MNKIKKNLISRLIENQVTSEEDSYGFAKPGIGEDTLEPKLQRFNKIMKSCGFSFGSIWESEASWYRDSYQGDGIEYIIVADNRLSGSVTVKEDYTVKFCLQFRNHNLSRSVQDILEETGLMKFQNPWYAHSFEIEIDDEGIDLHKASAMFIKFAKLIADDNPWIKDRMKPSTKDSTKTADINHKPNFKKYHESTSGSDLSFSIIRDTDGSEYFKVQALKSGGGVVAQIEEVYSEFDSGWIYAHNAGFCLVKRVIEMIGFVNSNYKISKTQVTDRAEQHGIQFNQYCYDFEETKEYFEKIVNFLNEIIDEANKYADIEEEFVDRLEIKF